MEALDVITNLVSDWISGVLVLFIAFLARILGLRQKFSPAVGLATGYYNNFLKPVINALSNNIPIEAKMASGIEKKHYKKIYIYLTDRSEDNSSENLALMKKRVKASNGIGIIRGEINTDIRGKAVDIMPRTGDSLENSILFDYPTTVANIPDIIKHRYSNTRFLNREKALRKYEIEEIETFKKTLLSLLGKERSHFIEFTKSDPLLINR
ncbi:MAG: STING domain-containing protein [Verrucomicrobiota bacterium]